MRENVFQAHLIKEIKKIFLGCVILKNDPNYIQGIPDLLILHKNKWAMLEVKKSEKSPHRPNQDFYVKYLNSIGFSRFIYPENKKEVLCELRRHLNGDNEIQ